MSPRALLVVLPPLLLLAAFLGFLAAEARARPKGPGLYWSEGVVRQVRGLVEDTYVDEVPPDRARALFYSACKAYVSGLDPYCEFLTPEERRAMEQQTQGEFGGIGILGSASGEGIRVRGTRRDDPAWKAGLRAGDVIVSVDGADAAGEKGAGLLQRLRGEPGTSVRLSWRPGGGGAPREAAVPRGKIKMDSVLGVGLADPGAAVGYLRIARFQENTAEDLRTALRRLRADGARSFVLDLRSDFGGVLPAAVGCADCFLAAGTVVVTRSREGIERPARAAGPDPDDILDAPLLLLVDGNTASAAEILAGALQDHRRAVLVGERTYGKFLVQRIVPLEGDDVALRLTTARYFTPFGRNLQRDDAHGVRGGLVPEVPVTVTESERQGIRARFEDQVGLDWDVVPPPPGTPAPPADPILDRALRILRDADALAGEGGSGPR